MLAEHAKLIPLRVGEHDPWLLALSDVNSSSAQGKQTVDLLILILRAKVEVEPILARLPIKNPDKQKPRKPVRRRTDLEYLDRLVDDHPPQRPSPPASQRHRILRVNAYLFPFKTHGHKV
jgi:hypothetical protein